MPIANHASLLSAALVCGATVILWATARLPEYLVALLFFAAAAVLRLAPSEAIFSGFASPAFWLILSGFVLGAAIRKVGLAERAASGLAALLTTSWPRMVGLVVLVSYALAFVMPSNMGRIALLMPIILALARRAGLEAGGRGQVALALAVGVGTFQLSASILPSNVPNLVMAGAAERAFGLRFAYLPYLLLHGPVLGLLKGAVLTAAIVWLFPAQPQPVPPPPRAEPLSADERRLVALLLVTLALWMTDSLHGVSPAWVALAAACLCLLPRVGFLSGEEFARDVNLRTCLYIAGILGLAAVVSATGLSDQLGRALLAVVPLDPTRPAVDFAAIVGLTSVLNFAVTASSVPALITPLGDQLARGAGFPLASALMIQVIGYATPLLPYQASPIVVAMGMGGVSVRDGTKLCLVLAAVTFLVLAPLDYAWFRLLGWI